MFSPKAVVVFGVSWKFICAAVATGLLFWLLPEIDLAVSSWFYHEGKFYLKKFPPLRAVYWLAPKLVCTFGIALAVCWLSLLCRRSATMFGLPRRAFLYLFAAIWIGPVLVVNVLLKDHVGRPRPSQIEEFGGTQKFAPAFVYCPQGGNNSSFVCGHAAAGYYFMALALVLRGHRRQVVWWSAVVAGTGIGLARVAQGAHFLSDVVFCFVFMHMVCQWLHAAMFAAWPGRIPVSPVNDSGSE